MAAAGAAWAQPATPARDPVRGTGSAVVRGRIAAPDGKPLRKVLVRITGPSVNLAVYSDDEGRYVLDGLPPGRYTLTAARNGYLTRGQPLEPVDLTLWPAGVITGQVLDQRSASAKGRRRPSISN
jgi:hypothetical protein